jgi:hypothetical protein
VAILPDAKAKKAKAPLGQTLSLSLTNDINPEVTRG